MKIKRLRVLCLILAVLTVGMGTWAVTGQVRIAGLKKQLSAAQTSPEVAADDAAATIEVADPDAIAAEFEGGVITAGEAAEEYARVSAYYQLMGRSEEEYAEDAKLDTLDGLIENKILENKARELGVYETTDEEMAQLEARVQEEYEDNLRYYMEFRYEEGKSEEEVRQETIAYLDANGYSYESMLESAQRDAWKQRLYEAVTQDMTIDDAQMREFYETQLASAELTYSADYSVYEAEANAGRTMVWNPEGVRRIQSLQVSFSDDQGVEYLTLQAELTQGDSAAQAELDALYETLVPQAQQLLDRIHAGEDFEQLMIENGATDTDGAYVSEKSSSYSQSYLEAAMALEEVGDVSGLVRTDGGICILRYAADVPAGAVPYEEVRDALLETYTEEMKSSQYNATVVGWIQNANVRYYTDTF